MGENKTDTNGVAYKHGYQAAAAGEELKKPYKLEEKNVAWAKGYSDAVSDFDIK